MPKLGYRVKCKSTSSGGCRWEVTYPSGVVKSKSKADIVRLDIRTESQLASLQKSAAKRSLKAGVEKGRKQAIRTRGYDCGSAGANGKARFKIECRINAQGNCKLYCNGHPTTKKALLEKVGKDGQRGMKTKITNAKKKAASRAVYKGAAIIRGVKPAKRSHKKKDFKDLNAYMKFTTVLRASGQMPAGKVTEQAKAMGAAYRNLSNAQIAALKDASSVSSASNVLNVKARSDSPQPQVAVSARSDSPQAALVKVEPILVKVEPDTIRTKIAESDSSCFAFMCQYGITNDKELLKWIENNPNNLIIPRLQQCGALKNFCPKGRKGLMSQIRDRYTNLANAVRNQGPGWLTGGGLNGYKKVLGLFNLYIDRNSVSNLNGYANAYKKLLDEVFGTSYNKALTEEMAKEKLGDDMFDPNLLLNPGSATYTSSVAWIRKNFETDPLFVSGRAALLKKYK